MGDSWTNAIEQRDDPRWLLLVLAGSAIGAWVLKAVADATSGARHDLPLVNSLSWFAFMLFATLAFMTMVAVAIRLPQALLRSRRR